MSPPPTLTPVNPNMTPLGGSAFLTATNLHQPTRPITSLKAPWLPNMTPTLRPCS